MAYRSISWPDTFVFFRPAPGLAPPRPPILFDFVGTFHPSFITLLISQFLHTKAPAVVHIKPFLRFDRPRPAHVFIYLPSQDVSLCDMTGTRTSSYLCYASRLLTVAQYDELPLQVLTYHV